MLFQLAKVKDIGLVADNARVPGDEQPRNLEQTEDIKRVEIDIYNCPNYVTVYRCTVPDSKHFARQEEDTKPVALGYMCVFSDQGLLKGPFVRMCISPVN